MGRRVKRIAARLALILFLLASGPNLACSQAGGPDVLRWWYMPILAEIEGPIFELDGAGVSGVNGAGMRIVGPVIFERVQVPVFATATFEDSEGRLYSTSSEPWMLSLWQVTARLSIYRDGQYWGTVELRQ